MEHATIAGRVVDADSGSALAGAQVTIIRHVEVPSGVFGEDVKHTVTAADGRFAFSRVRPGRYRVDVERTGYAPSLDPFDSKLFDLAAGKTIDDIEIALKKGGVIAGGVRDANGEPLPEMTVWAMRRVPPGHPIGIETIQAGMGQTNDLGEFRIAKLPEGDYLVVASHQRRMPSGMLVPTPTPAVLAPTYFPGTIDRRSAQVVAVRSGETVGGLWFGIVSVAAYSVSGVVVDEAGAPLGGAMVTLFPSMRLDAPVGPIMCHADADGTFEITGVIPGTYHINATAPMSGFFGGGSFFISEEGTATAEDGEIVFKASGGRQSDRVVVGTSDVRGIKVIAAAGGGWSS